MSRFVDISGGPEGVSIDDRIYLQTRGQLPPDWPELTPEEIRGEDTPVAVRHLDDVDLNEREYTGIADPNSPDAGPERDELRGTLVSQATYVPDSERELAQARADQASKDAAGERTTALFGAEPVEADDPDDERHTAKADAIAERRATAGRSTTASEAVGDNVAADPEREEITQRERGPAAVAVGRTETPEGPARGGTRGSQDTASDTAPRRAARKRTQRETTEPSGQDSEVRPATEGSAG
jgi:hypothetical protein